MRIVAAAKAQEKSLPSATQKLIRFILAWEADEARTQGAPDASPAAPLIELFTAGFQLQYSTAGIEIQHFGNIATMRVPLRDSLDLP